MPASIKFPNGVISCESIHRMEIYFPIYEASENEHQKYGNEQKPKLSCCVLSNIFES